MLNQKVHLKHCNISLALLALLLLLCCKNEGVNNQVIAKRNVVIYDMAIDTTSITQRNIVVNDTLYLYKKDFPNSNTQYHEHVYVTHDPREYLLLIPKVEYEDFSLLNHPYSNTEWENQRYKIEIGEIPNKWTEVIYYGNEYYLRSPSDFCWLNQKIITDSCLISRTCEGPYLEKITKVTRVNRNQYELQLGFDKEEPSKTRITIIDAARGIAIWQTKENEYELYADIAKFRSIPLAKTDCNGTKCINEILSDTLDIISLLKSAM